jgi:hypothetical protein
LLINIDKIPSQTDMRFSRRCWDVTPYCLGQLAEKAFASCLLGYTSTLKMKAVCSSETSISCQATRRRIPEAKSLQWERLGHLSRRQVSKPRKFFICLSCASFTSPPEVHSRTPLFLLSLLPPLLSPIHPILLIHSCVV